jgi:hypothetical protein
MSGSDGCFNVLTLAFWKNECADQPWPHNCSNKWHNRVRQSFNLFVCGFTWDWVSSGKINIPALGFFFFQASWNRCFQVCTLECKFSLSTQFSSYRNCVRLCTEPCESSLLQLVKVWKIVESRYFYELLSFVHVQSPPKLSVDERGFLAVVRQSVVW